MLSVRRLGKRFGSRWIFREISFDLGAGDRLAVIGANGSGKSTLLRVLASLLPATQGCFDFAGDPRLVIGYSALEQALYPNLTCREHLEFTARMRGCDPRTDELLDQIGLGHAQATPASHLSSGMKARLKMAIATQARPPVLLLDEPGASLDEAGRALVGRCLHEQSARGCTVFATNDPGERRLATLELELEG